MSENIKDFEGIIEDVQPQFDKNKKLFFKFKISGLTYNWFTANDKPGEETAKGLNKGDEVKGVVELNEGEYNGKPITYRNIKEMHKDNLEKQKEIDEIPVEQVKTNDEVKKEQPKTQEPDWDEINLKKANAIMFQNSLNNGMLWLCAYFNDRGSPQEILKVEYWKIVDYLFEESLKKRKEKIGY